MQKSGTCLYFDDQAERICLMIEQPQIVQTETWVAAVIRVVTPRSEIRKVMEPAIAELLGGLAAQGIAPAGPLFTHHLKTDAHTFDFELGVPVNNPVSATGRIKAGQLPAARVARTVYRGPYDGLWGAWKEFNEWVAAEGYTPAPGLWECYLSGPESNPDPAMWRTELNRPLLRSVPAR